MDLKVFANDLISGLSTQFVDSDPESSTAAGFDTLIPELYLSHRGLPFDCKLADSGEL